MPQGDYDDGATAFVKLPEGGIDALLSGDSPLAAPGHGYVPPRITATHADGTPGTWPVPDGGGRWPDADTAPGRPQGADDRFTYGPAATQQWTFEEPAAPAAPGHDVTGQWSIPVAGGDLPDESGEFTASSLVEQWGGGTPPATLPGGAAAPWATDGAGHSWGRPPAAPVPDATAVPDHTALPDDPAMPDHTGAHPAGADAAPEAYDPGSGYGHGTEYADGGQADTGQADTGHADGGHAGNEYADGHAENEYANGYAENEYADNGYAEDGYAEDEHPDGGRTGAGHADGEYPGSGHADAGHFAGGHAATGRPEGPDAGQGEGGHPDAGHPRAGHAGAGDGATFGGTGTLGSALGPRDTGTLGGAAAPGGPGAPDASGEPVPAERTRPEPGTAPEADAHGLAEAPERPADAPAGHEQHTGPGAAPRSATAPVTPDPAASEAPVTTAHPADPAGESGPAPADAAADPGDPATAPGDGTAVPGPAGTHGPADAHAPAEGDRAAEDPAPDGAAAPEEAGDQAAVALPPHDDHPLASYVLRVNGTDRPVTDAWIGESLLYVLRERLGLAGAKDGCSQGECGACNVQVDGRLVASCLVPAVTAAGSEVRTVEGLAEEGQPSDVQRALARCGAVQCGFCVPGMAMTVHDLLEGNPAPTELETRQALCGNLCRCSGYRGVLEAVKEVVAEREGAHAGSETDGDEARIPHQAGPGSGGVHPSAFDAPGVFDIPQTTPDGYGDAQDPAYGDTADSYGDGANPYGDTADPYGDTADPYGDAPGPYGTPPGQRDQHYGQDGGQA
nr:2Fe-2S iron-sulfur cluster-binding protein [Streptomyces sp. SID486]